MKSETKPSSSISRWLAPSIGALCAAAGVAGLSEAAASSSGFKLESHGMAPTALENKVDAAVESAFNAIKAPGISVAVTKGGRLILTKGYGKADINKVRYMTYMTRARIGSVSKAAFTGPATVQLLASKGISPKTKRLYGPGGIFGNTYDLDILTGVKRYTPISAIAIGPDDKVYTWYENGTVSVGWSRDLDSRQKPIKVAYPDGKRPVDIRDISIAKNGQVYTWYDDGTLSIGMATDLDRYAKPDPDNKVKMPSGKSMLNVVGIGIAKSNDHVYAWYDDGTFSSGYSRDFDHHFKPKPYSIYNGPAVPSPAGTGMTRYHIRSMDIASNDHVYTWFSNDRVMEGMSDNLDRYTGPAPYSMATLPPRRAPDENGVSAYRSITVQNLLDHTAGFAGSGDTEGAMKMFNVSENKLTYSMAHQHFLRTRKLMSRPGTRVAYSNHGFGTCTLIVEKLAGKSFRNYVMNDYLSKVPNLGLNAVPESASMPTHSDAMPYTLTNDGKFVAVERTDSTLGLAAGGFMASARDLLLVTKYLRSKYSYAQIDDLGWFKSGKGKLDHNGKRTGGTCYVAMFPTGYKSNSGVDLSDLHVAIVVSADTDTAKLSALADAIALAVPSSNVPSNYDVWKAKPAGG